MRATSANLSFLHRTLHSPIASFRRIGFLFDCSAACPTAARIYFGANQFVTYAVDGIIFTVESQRIVENG